MTENPILQEETNQKLPPYFKKVQEFPKIDQVPPTETIDFIGHYGPIKKIIGTSTQKYPNCILTISNDRRIIFWNVKSNKMEKIINLDFEIKDIAITQNDILIPVGEKIIKYDLNQEKVVFEIKHKLGKYIEYTSLAFINDAYFIVSSLNHYFLLIDVNSFKIQKKINMYCMHYICSIENKPKDEKKKKTLEDAAVSDIEEEEEEEPEGKKRKKEEEKKEENMEERRIGSGKCLSSKNGHRGNVYFILNLKNSKYNDAVITAGDDPIIKIMSLNLATLNNEEMDIKIDDLIGHNDNICAITLFNNNENLLSGSFDWTVRKWNLDTLQCEKVIEQHKGRINFICSMLNSSYILSTATDKKLVLYDKEGNLIKRFEYNNGLLFYVSEGLENNFIFGDSHGNLFIEKLIE